jgi:hypothetical protein
MGWILTAESTHPTVANRLANRLPISSTVLWHLHRTQTGGDGGVPLSVRLVNETSDVTGGYGPAEESTRTGVHAESPEFSGGQLKLKRILRATERGVVD